MQSYLESSIRAIRSRFWCWASTIQRMFVYVAAGADGPYVRSAEDLSTLSVRVDTGPGDWDALARTLHGAAAGEVSGAHAWLDTGWLRAAAGDTGADWTARFDRMLDVAAAHGWLSTDRRLVRAHVEWDVRTDDNPTKG